MIVDDDGSVEASIMADQPVVAEGQPATFTVELSGTVAEEVPLRYTTGNAGDTATAGEDYRATDTEVVIPAGAMSATITVATLPSDGVDEDDRFFSVRLLDEGLPEGLEIDTRPARVTITDHEIRASVTAPSTPVNEGSAAVFTVSLNVGLDPARNRTGVEVQYAIAGDVTRADYREAPTGTVTFQPGDNQAKLTITTIADDVLDPEETLTLRLTDATSLMDQGLAIVDPERGEDSTTVADEGSVTWSVADISVEEDEPAIFTVTLSALVQDNVTLTYRTTPDGTAMAGSDYTAVLNGTVTVIGGTPSANFTVATIDDSQGESTETFTVELRLSNAPDGVGPRDRTVTATATIRDDDIVLRPVDAVTITEGQTRTIPLTLEQALRAPVTVRYTAVPGTTVDTNDFSIALPPGAPQPDAEGTFTLRINFQEGGDRGDGGGRFAGRGHGRVGARTADRAAKRATRHAGDDKDHD